MLLQICKKINIVPNTEICFFPYTCHIVNENYGAGNVNSWQQICNLSISVYFNSLLNLVISVLLYSSNSQKFTANLHDGARLSYIQAEELSLATVYRSQQLYTAEQWLNCNHRSLQVRPDPEGVPTTEEP